MTGKLIGIARTQKPRQPMEEIGTVGVSVESGLDLDRRGKVANRQVTILFREDWEAACTAVGESLPWTMRRANLLVEGLDNPAQLGARIQVGSVLLEVGEETAPCSLMEKSHSGLRTALSPDWRGGVSCNVIEGGTLQIGDSVSVATKEKVSA